MWTALFRSNMKINCVDLLFFFRNWWLKTDPKTSGSCDRASWRRCTNAEGLWALAFWTHLGRATSQGSCQSSQQSSTERRWDKSYPRHFALSKACVTLLPGKTYYLLISHQNTAKIRSNGTEAVLWSKMPIFKRAYHKLSVLPHLCSP